MAVRVIKRSLTKAKGDATDMALLVTTTTDEEINKWDRQRIVDSLVKETTISPLMAERISRDVEDQVRNSRIQTLTTDLIRELINVKFLEYGLDAPREEHQRLGLPIYDVEQLILNANKENANIPHNPEATNLTLSEILKKEYALARVFTPEVREAHMTGDIHLHDLGFIDRPYCSGQSLEYIKRFGLDLPNAMSIAKPAKHAVVLLAHMVKFSAALQGHFAGAIGWDAVNLFFAPYLEELSDRDVSQLAQMMIYEYSQQAVARGGQAIFSDINIYWEVPRHFEKVKAIGPGGEYTGKTYAEYEKQAQRLAWALFEEYARGDGSGRPFFFPKPLVHITDKFFTTPGHEDFLRLICQVATDMGNTYFVFDRGQTAKISECCRLSFNLNAEDLADANHPWKMRFSALQNVTVNLPRIAFKTGDVDEALREISRVMDLCAQAHLQKRDFIDRILRMGTRGTLALLATARDGEPYLRMRRVTYLIGVLGLNEMIKALSGRELHETREAFKLGLKIIGFMKLKCQQLSRKHGLKLVLEQTPAESTAYRFAKLDLKYFPDQTAASVQGDIDANEIYYTNSTYFNNSLNIDAIDRVEKEGQFHPLIDAGALTHIWLGESHPSWESIADFVIKTFRKTQNAQIAFSPEFTVCNACGKTSRGLLDSCPHCSAREVDGITRVTGYFSKISSWNKGKVAELKSRHRNTL